MKRVSLLLTAAALGSCHAQQPKAQTDLCGLSWGLRGWSGVTMRVRGIVDGGSPDGFSLSGEHCLNGGKVDVAPDALNRDRLLKRLDSIGVRPGITRIDVEVKVLSQANDDLDDGATMRVTGYFGGSFQPMGHSEQQKYRHM